MNGKVSKLFGVVMALVLAVTLSGVALIPSTAPAEAVTALKWVEIPTPGEDDLQLFPGSDVGVIAVSPDGGTLFAAVYEDSGAFPPSNYPPASPGDDGWRIFKSSDGGYTWRETGYYADVYDAAGYNDNTPIVDIVVSPLWENKQYLYVATQDNAYWSSNGGNDFSRLGNDMSGFAQINCMDVGVDEDGLIRVVIGNGIPSTLGAAGVAEGGNDVYLLVFDQWVPQKVGLNLQAIDAVLDVAFAPTYGDEAMDGYGFIFALVRANRFVPPTVDETILRCETQAVEIIGDQGNWGAPVQDAYFNHNGALECGTCGILADHGRMTFAEDFADQMSVFVGLTAWEPAACATVFPPPSRGDVFRVDIGTKIILPSVVNDLDVRGTDTLGCNIWSLDVSGDADSAYILAGLHEMTTTGASSTWQSGVHFSDNGGTTWMQGFKPPSGLCNFAFQWGEPNLVMAPDFDSSGIAYCGTGKSNIADLGAFSGFWVSTYEGTSWNGRGLLDMKTEAITSIDVSPNYASDENMFMVQAMTIEVFSGIAGGPIGILWETNDAGSHWEVILAMNALFPFPGVNIEWVELPHNWPSDDAILVTGRLSIQPVAQQSMIIRSNDAGKTFTSFIQGPQDAGVAYRPPNMGSCWDTPDYQTIFIGDDQGGVWFTDNEGYAWWKCSDTDIPMGQAITDLVERDGDLLVGTEDGTVYVCYDWPTDGKNYRIERVGEIVGAVGDWTSVAFDAEYETNDIIYCGLDDWAIPFNDGEVWRFDLGASVWEQISEISIAPIPSGWEDILDYYGGKFSEMWTVLGIPVSYPMYVGSLTEDLTGWPVTPYPLIAAGGNALVSGEEGTLYAIDEANGIVWRCTDPELATITLGTSPLWEPLGDGLGWPNNLPTNAKVLNDLEVVTGSNILFAIGQDSSSLPTIWTYHDTLTADLGPLDLIRPTDGSIGVGTLADDKTQSCLILQWEPATDATMYEWEIGTGPELKVDGGFISLWAHAQFLQYWAGATDTARFTNGEAIQGCLPTDVDGEKYYWHVRVVEPFQSPWSETWSFTTMPTSTAERPMLTNPANGETNVPRRPAFTWTQAVGADEYELTVWECANAGSPVIEKTGDNAVTGLFYQATQDLKYDTNYCWQVTAIGGNNPSSAAGTFTTLAAPVEEEEEGTPYWVWVVIGVSALMLIAVIVLIVLTKKA